MSRYIQFETEDGEPLLIEVDEADVSSSRGVVKAGLKEKTQHVAAAAVDLAQTTFEQAIDRVVRQNARVFIRAVRQMPVPPAEVEVTFSVKATGELSNAAVGKVGGDANYNVRLVWRAPDATTAPNAAIDGHDAT
jgi:hypothetical protein